MLNNHLVHMHAVPKKHIWVHLDVPKIILRSTKEQILEY